MLKQYQQGISLIELMVGITLSLLLILGVTQIFLTSKNTYSSNQALSAVQESGRFAVELMARDIRNAGYIGQCLQFVTNHIDDAADAVWALNDEPIQGWEEEKPSFIDLDIAEGTDVIFVQFATGGVDVEGDALNDAVTETISFSDGTAPASIDDVLLISDGLGCDLFRADSIADGEITKDSDVNWSHAYTDSFEILSFESVAYYIAEEGSGVPTLHRSRFNYELDEELEVEELVPGIVSLDISYGVGSNKIVDEYVDASSVTNWGNVSSVRLTLVTESASGLQREFTTTVGLRNRLP